MGRELHPDLFESSLKNASMPATNVSVDGVSVSDFTEFRMITERKSNVLADTVESMGLKIEELNTKITRLSRAAGMSFEKITPAVSELQKNVTKNTQDIERKTRWLTSKLEESKINANKVESLMERQNMVIKSFETKLANIQKILSQKEMQILNLSEALKEARVEIKKLLRLG